MANYKCYADGPVKNVSAAEITAALTPTGAPSAPTPSHPNLDAAALQKLPIEQLSVEDVKRLSRAQQDAARERPTPVEPKRAPCPGIS